MGHEMVDGAECYVVIIHATETTNTLWIDTKAFLLRRMKEEQNEQQLIAEETSMNELRTRFGHGKSLRVSAMKMKSSERVHSFKIDKVNGKVEEKLFADPTKK